MATTEFDVSQLRYTLGAKFAFLARFAIRRIVGLRRAMENRRSVKQLLAWDSRMLADIGLTESDVRSAMSGRVSEDPSHRLTALAVERRAAIREAARERLDVAANVTVSPERHPVERRVKIEV